MRIWVSSPSIEWNGHVYLREHMEIPTELLWLEWHSQNLTILFYKFFCLLWTKILPFSCMMVKFSHLLRRKYVKLCICVNMTPTFVYFCIQNGRTLQIYTDFVLMGLAKKSIVFSPFLFSGSQSINQRMNIFFALRMFREMRYRPYCFVIHHR